MKSYKDLTEELFLEGGDRYPGDNMTMKELKIAINSAKNILDMLEEGAYIQRWQLSAIAIASEELASVCTSMRADEEEEDEIDMKYDEYGYPSMYGEEVELDEISKKTLGSYIRKASDQVSDRGFEAGFKSGRGKSDDAVMKPYRKGEKRLAGISKAVGKLQKEEAELDEAEMSLYDKIKQARANPSPDKPVRGRGSKNTNPKTYDARDKLDKEDDRLQAMIKKRLKKEEAELDEAANKLVARYMNKSGSNVLYVEIYEKPNGNYFHTIKNQRGINVSASAIDLKSSHANAKKNVDRVTMYYDQDGDAGALKFLNSLLPGWKKAPLREEVELGEEYKVDEKEIKKVIQNAKKENKIVSVEVVKYLMTKHDIPHTVAMNIWNNMRREFNEEQDYKVSVDGLPDMYVKANSPAEVKANLRKIVKKPDMVKSVDRVTQSVIKKIFRDKAAGKEGLDEAVEVRHDRYMRSHGKKASGGMGSWMFTHKNMGDVNYRDEKDVFTAPRGKFSDAKKAAQQWAKKHGHSTVYVMESVELD